MASPTIVLIHGAFGDASSWQPVFERLVDEGHTVLAPPNPLRGLPYDASYTASVIDQLDPPVLLVGHSYGGAVITVAGSSDKVAGLVYVAGVAPDEGESVNDLQGRFPVARDGPARAPPVVVRRQRRGVDRPRAVPRRLLRRHSGGRRGVHGDLAADGLGHGVRRSRHRRRLADEAVLGGVRHRRLPGRLRSCTASPTTAPARRSPRSKAPPTSYERRSRTSSQASFARPSWQARPTKLA